jgi:hypothetical protein
MSDKILASEGNWSNIIALIEEAFEFQTSEAYLFDPYLGENEIYKVKVTMTHDGNFNLVVNEIAMGSFQSAGKVWEVIDNCINGGSNQ